MEAWYPRPKGRSFTACPGKISPEILKGSTFIGKSKNLPAIGAGTNSTDMIEPTRKVDLTEIRRKYN